jgi:hypothetical protein
MKKWGKEGEILCGATDRRTGKVFAVVVCTNSKALLLRRVRIV